MSETTLNRASRNSGHTRARSAAMVAGTGYISLFLLAIFANFMVKEGLIVPGNAAETAANITSHAGLFRWGMMAFLLIFLIDIFVAWGLFILFGTVHKDLSLLAAWFRIVYTVFLGVALVFYFQALQYLGMSSSYVNLPGTVREVHSLIALESFNSVWLIGLTAFGIHLVILGVLILKSRMAPRVLGIFLVTAGSAYMADTGAHVLLSNYHNYAGIMIIIVALPSVLAEGWFGGWLLLKGGRKQV